MRRSFFAFFQRYKQLLPLLLLTVYCLSALVAFMRGIVVTDDVTYGITLTAKHYLAFCAIVLNFLIYYLFRKFYKYSLALTILAGLFNAMVFPLSNASAGIDVNSLKIMVQPSAFFAGLLAYALNFKRINNTLWQLLKTSSESREK